jgi:hypothetical protein
MDRICRQLRGSKNHLVKGHFTPLIPESIKTYIGRPGPAALLWVLSNSTPASLKTAIERDGRHLRCFISNVFSYYCELDHVKILFKLLRRLKVEVGSMQVTFMGNADRMQLRGTFSGVEVLEFIVSIFPSVSAATWRGGHENLPSRGMYLQLMAESMD